VHFEQGQRIFPSAHADKNNASQMRKIQNDFLSKVGIGDPFHIERTHENLQDLDVQLNRFKGIAMPERKYEGPTRLVPSNTTKISYYGNPEYTRKYESPK
jgi:hypothetical protein